MQIRNIMQDNNFDDGDDNHGADDLKVLFRRNKF